MQLRETIRLPERLHQDHVYLPLSRKPLRKAKSALKPRCPEYNPDLPPAAFPTLDKQRTGGNQNTKTNDDRENGARSLEDMYQLTGSGNQEENSVMSEFKPVPMSVLENSMASNGIWNQTYLSNMAKLAVAGHFPAILDRMEESDDEETVTRASKFSRASIKPPTWAGLSRRMQTEIFSNLLERYDWSRVNRMLSLSEQECKAIEDLLCRRSQQMKFEDAELSAMRAKQLRDILKVDNSASSRPYPYQLVFRKASRQTFSVLRKAVEADSDFLCCEGVELNAARNFLRGRDIEVTYAGDWGNDIVLVQAEEEEELVLEPFEPRSSPILHSSGNAETSVIPTQPEATDTTRKGAFLNWLGSSNDGNSVAYALPDCDPSPSSEFLTICFKNLAGPEMLQGRKRKRDDHDQTRHGQPFSASAASFCLESPRAHHYISAGVSERLAQLHGATRGSISTRSFSLADSYSDHVNPDLENSLQEPTSFFLDVIGEIITARDEEAHARTPGPREFLAENSIDNRDYELLGLVKTPVFIGLSPSPAPSRAESLAGSDEQLWEFSTLGSPGTNATGAKSSPASCASVYQADRIELQQCGSGVSPSTPESLDLYDGSCQEEEADDGVHEDEMVLLSTELQA
ncbi:hypothetical protein BJX64DRAFT_283506 [Aspergillus heterothallicus]